MSGKSKKKRSPLLGMLIAAIILIGIACAMLLFRPDIDDGTEVIATKTTEAVKYREKTSAETEVTDVTIHNTESVSDAEVNSTTEESSAECEHEFEIQMQENNLPQCVCTKCGNVDVEQSIPLIYYNKVSDTNSADDGKDILIGDFKKYGSKTIIKNAIKFWVIDAKGYVDTESIDFYLGGSCFFLTGSVIPADQCDQDANMTVRFYGDGTLLEEVSDITASAFSLAPFMIDVRGVQVLRVECTTDSDVFGHCIVESSLN